jgi:hypothetical protein
MPPRSSLTRFEVSVDRSVIDVSGRFEWKNRQFGALGNRASALFK